MILFHAHAFPAKSLEKGAKTEFTPVFRRRWHQTLPPPSSTGKLPPIAIWKEGAPSGMWLSSADTFPPQQGKETSKKTLEFQTSGYNPPKGGLLF